MTLEELKAKLPAEIQPWVSQYGPAFIAMTTNEIAAWIDKVAAGDVCTAYKDVLKKLPNSDLMTAWDDLNAEWQTANVANNNRVKLQSEAVAAILRILLTIALASVGL